MWRRIRQAMIFLSSLLCVTSVFLWVRSLYRWDTLVTRRPAHGMGVLTGSGVSRSS